jgi:hypothetical protein
VVVNSSKTFSPLLSSSLPLPLPPLLLLIYLPLFKFPSTLALLLLLPGFLLSTLLLSCHISPLAPYLFCAVFSIARVNQRVLYNELLTR